MVVPFPVGYWLRPDIYTKFSAIMIRLYRPKILRRADKIYINYRSNITKKKIIFCYLSIMRQNNSKIIFSTFRRYLQRCPPNWKYLQLTPSKQYVWVCMNHTEIRIYKILNVYIIYLRSCRVGSTKITYVLSFNTFFTVIIRIIVFYILFNYVFFFNFIEILNF